MDKKYTAKVMFLELVMGLTAMGIVYSIFNKLFYLPLPLRAFVHIIFIMAFGGSVFIFLVNVMALFGENDDDAENIEKEVKTTKRNKNDKWIKLK